MHRQCGGLPKPVIPESCEDLLIDADFVVMSAEPVNTTLAIAESVVSAEMEPVPPVGWPLSSTLGGT